MIMSVAVMIKTVAKETKPLRAKLVLPAEKIRLKVVNICSIRVYIAR